MEKRLRKLGIAERNPNLLSDAEIKRFVRLDIDPATITWRRVVDICDRMLRGITVGKGPLENGFTRETGFDITGSADLLGCLVAMDWPVLNCCGAKPPSTLILLVSVHSGKRDYGRAGAGQRHA